MERPFRSGSGIFTSREDFLRRGSSVVYKSGGELSHIYNDNWTDDFGYGIRGAGGISCRVRWEQKGSYRIAISNGGSLESHLKVVGNHYYVAE